MRNYAFICFNQCLLCVEKFSCDPSEGSNKCGILSLLQAQIVKIIYFSSSAIHQIFLITVYPTAKFKIIRNKIYRILSKPKVNHEFFEDYIVQHTNKSPEGLLWYNFQNS